MLDVQDIGHSYLSEDSVKKKKKKKKKKKEKKKKIEKEL